MKVLPISDIHGNDSVLDYIVDNIPNDTYDVITVSGDVWEGATIKKKYTWINFQESVDRPIILIQGNHDYSPSSVFDDVPNIHLLYNNDIEIDGVTFFGTPNTVNFGMWNHMNDEEYLLDLWDKNMPNNVDVVLSHGPPHGYCDNCNQPVYGNNSESMLGSKSLKTVLLDKSPKYVFCGHIHTGDRFSVMSNGTKIYNVSCLDEAYQFMVFNPAPEVIELDI
jgi:Icc-related predicted phosphoesterase